MDRGMLLHMAVGIYHDGLQTSPRTRTVGALVCVSMHCSVLLKQKTWLTLMYFYLYAFYFLKVDTLSKGR